MYASMYDGSLPIVAFLVEQGADINITNKVKRGGGELRGWIRGREDERKKEGGEVATALL